ncbi:MAG: type II secretion system F family protein, partial [Mycobacteriales bacterium]
AGAETGAPFGGVFAELADWLASRESDRLEAEAELSGVRTSARLLMLLPVSGMFVSAFAGAGAPQILLDTTTGHLLVLVAACLLLVGRAWLSRIVRSAISSGDYLDAVKPARAEPQKTAGRGARLAAAMSAAAAVAALVGAPLGLPLAALTGWCAWWLTGSLEPVGLRRLRDQQLAALPLALELLAACRAAGLPPAVALSVTATAAPPSLVGILSRSSSLLRLGACAGEAYCDWPDTGDLGAARRLLIRCAESGAPAAPALRRIASRARFHQRVQSRARIRRATVASLLPLTCCYLPAFVLLGVVPLGLGLFAALHRLG